MSLAESLKHMADLDRLDLKCNKIGDTGAVAITNSPFDSPIGLIHQPRNFLSYEVFLQIGVPMGS